MSHKILKIKEWIKFRHPDYDGFQKHVEAWEKDCIPYGFKDLLRISLAYNIEPPTIIGGKLVFPS